MDKEKLKLIVRNLKSLVNALESEVYSDVNAYKNSDAFSSRSTFIYHFLAATWISKRYRDMNLETVLIHNLPGLAWF